MANIIGKTRKTKYTKKTKAGVYDVCHFETDDNQVLLDESVGDIPKGAKLHDVLERIKNSSIIDDRSDVSSIATQLQNANDAKVDVIYTILGASNEGYTNYPDGAIDGGRDLLITFKSKFNGNDLYDQYFINYTDTYHRWKDGGKDWSQWEKRHSAGTIIDDHSNVSSIATQLSNADDAKVDTIYTILGASNEGYTNFPDGAIDGGRDLLITFKSEFNGNDLYDQYFINYKNTYHRWKDVGKDWSAWELHASAGAGKVFSVMDGNTTTLINTIAEAIKTNGSTVFLNGTFDLSLIGGFHDIILGNDVKIIGSSGTLIKFCYTGSNSSVQMYVSPFRKQENGGGFTLENITMICKNVRYCVHDEDSGNDDIYHNYYRNCFFELDNTENPVWHVSQTIGGGLGTNGHVVIENSKFVSHGDFARTLGDVSYHNSGQSYGKSHITITGCHFTTTFRAGWWGTTKEMTEVLLSNNSFAIPPICKPENTEEKAQTENMRLISFNNIIRENDDVGLFSRIYSIPDATFHSVTDIINLMEEGKEYMLIPANTVGRVLLQLESVSPYVFSGNPVMIWKYNGGVYTSALLVDTSGKTIASNIDNPFKIINFAYCNVYRVN